MSPPNRQGLAWQWTLKLVQRISQEAPGPAEGLLAEHMRLMLGKSGSRAVRALHAVRMLCKRELRGVGLRQRPLGCARKRCLAGLIAAALLTTHLRRALCGPLAAGGPAAEVASAYVPEVLAVSREARAKAALVEIEGGYAGEPFWEKGGRWERA